MEILPVHERKAFGRDATQSSAGSYVPLGAVLGFALGRGTKRKSNTAVRGTAGVEVKEETSEVTDKRGYDREAWIQGYNSAQEEICCSLYSEALPKGLRGSYFRNGPAKFKVGDDQIMHPFDGDGMVCAVTFDGMGHAHFRNRYVRTPGFVEELEAKKMLYRGQFSQKSGGFLANAFDMRVKNLANTNVMHWAGRLFALWEGGKPMELDSLSLGTKGFSDFGGSLKEKDTFTAHPRFDAKTGRQVGFQYQPDPVAGITKISCWEFAPEGFDLVRRVDVEVPGFGFYHDFLVTDSYYILSRAPVEISPQRGLEGLLGLRSMGESIDFDEQKPTQLVLVPRDGSEVRYVDLDTHFCFHYANGFEEGEKLILDFVRTPSLELGNASAQQKPLWEVMELESLDPNRFTRYEIDKSGSWTKQELSDQHVDFPSINPAYSTKPYRFAWCATSALDGVTAPLQGLVKVDVTGKEQQQIWLPEAQEFIGEVIFCPRDGGEAEDDGYLVGISVDGRKKSSDLLVFDARDIRDGPICRLPLPAFIPHALHGSYVPDLVPSAAEIQTAWDETPTSL